jgi:hypothetical protein
MGVVRIHELQDSLAEVETYKTGGVWLGSLVSKHIPEGQAELQDAFDKCAHRIRTRGLRDTEALATTLAQEEPASASSQALVPMPSGGEPLASISAVLLPTFNQLQDIAAQFRGYLHQLGVLNEKELVHFYWLQFQLNHIESGCKHGGIWVGDVQHGSVPAGQAQVQQQLEECHRLAHRVNTEREVYSQLHEQESMGQRNKKEMKIWREMKCT